MATADITWRDAQQMPEDGRRYEAVEGNLYVTAAPSARHQEISARLTALLHRLLVGTGRGRLFHAPGVEFPETGEGVQPDLVFVSTERGGIIAEDWLRGAPDLIVEILSPSTENRDRGVKRDLYRRQGAGQYWLVDPGDDAVEVWRFESSGAKGEATHERYTDRLPVRLGGEAVGEIDLEEAGRALSDADLQIAATALRHGLELVTGSLRHFRRVPDLEVCRALDEARS